MILLEALPTTWQELSILGILILSWLSAIKWLVKLIEDKDKIHKEEITDLTKKLDEAHEREKETLKQYFETYTELINSLENGKNDN